MPRQVARKTGVASGAPASRVQRGVAAVACLVRWNPVRSASWQQMAAGSRPKSRPLTTRPTTSRNQIIFTIIMKNVSLGRPIIDSDACQPTSVPTAIPQCESSRQAIAAAAIRGAASRTADRQRALRLAVPPRRPRQAAQLGDHPRGQDRREDHPAHQAPQVAQQSHADDRAGAVDERAAVVGLHRQERPHRDVDQADQREAQVSIHETCRTIVRPKLGSPSDRACAGGTATRRRPATAGPRRRGRTSPRGLTGRPSRPAGAGPAMPGRPPRSRS